MTTNNKPKHLPINHREPTKEELCAQMDREEQQSGLGRIRAEIDLQDQKKGMDYARSQGGQFLLNKCLNLTSAAIEQEPEDLGPDSVPTGVRSGDQG